MVRDTDRWSVNLPGREGRHPMRLMHSEHVDASIGLLRYAKDATGFCGRQTKPVAQALYFREVVLGTRPIGISVLTGGITKQG